MLGFSRAQRAPERQPGGGAAPAEPGYLVLLYYKFVAVPSPELLRKEQQYLCEHLGLKGRVFVAAEGINGTLSGPACKARAYMDFMARHPLFAGMEFKVDGHTGHAFRKLNVRVKKEIVALGLGPDIDAAHKAAPYIEPAEMRELLRKPQSDVVILDTRSRYEFEVGKFKGAHTLDIENFRELPAHAPEIEALKGKKIVTYCTGGIRCEKVTAWLLQQGFKSVVQLHGGIIRYGHEMGGEDFEGQCYVFDQRIAVPVNRVNPKVIGKCVHCAGPTERMVNCANADCNDQVLLCATCLPALEGCCSEACHQSPRRRAFDGLGQYYRGHNSKNYAAPASGVQAPESR